VTRNSLEPMVTASESDFEAGQCAHRFGERAVRYHGRRALGADTSPR
jgi:hypothetical protein